MCWCWYCPCQRSRAAGAPLGLRSPCSDDRSVPKTSTLQKQRKEDSTGQNSSESVIKFALLKTSVRITQLEQFCETVYEIYAMWNFFRPTWSHAFTKRRLKTLNEQQISAVISRFIELGLVSSVSTVSVPPKQRTEAKRQCRQNCKWTRGPSLVARLPNMEHSRHRCCYIGDERRMRTKKADKPAPTCVHYAVRKT